METIGLGLHFEDLPVGRTFRTVGRTITEPDIVNFVGATGMTEVLFTDMEYVAQHSDIKGGRVAPGSLVFSMAEGLVLVATLQHTGVAFLGMELNILGPVVAGDTIHVECEVVEARLTSKRGRGLVRTRNRIVNQRGETVIEYTPLRMMKCRNGN
ncbi:MAG: acyl dehydratase [Sneathiella sp.]|jgi:acyl dehydratase|uniref:MaoC/PaaZ C-terminal domain-containing protein n=1 Tax=Sneathiella sp. TaxID=1964365 RepID=UPI000C69894A|nr:MaoC/PaaZ C-terminal domain-containing protein [Sneathiella sp.]MAL78584.1 acyl dehydratase [Sneathiella sp.]|tara:strand:- start:1036 stop:1500 length:465 start_codon:yes stop_codon:yes gene_type:complete